MSIFTKHSHITISILIIIVTLFLISLYGIFQNTKNNIKNRLTNSRIEYMNEISKNIVSNLDFKKANSYLSLFKTKKFPYIFILKRKNKHLFFIADANQNTSFMQPFIPEKENLKYYLTKKPIYFYHKKNKQLYITYIYPFKKIIYL